MKNKIGKIFRIVFLSMYLFICLLYLATVFIPMLPPLHWWFISMLAYIFPGLLLALLLFIPAWALQHKRRYVFVSIAVILCGWKNITSCFAMGNYNGTISAKDPASIRVLTWNVMRMVGIEGTQAEKDQVKHKAVKLIVDQQPDIICLQEYVNGAPHTGFSIIALMADSLGYKYSFFSRDFEWFEGTIHQGVVIFSKYPIIDSGKVKFPPPTSPQSIIYADIKKGKDIFRVYTTHLQSFRLMGEDYESLHNLKTEYVADVDDSKRIFRKVKRGLVNRSIQADLVRRELDKSPFPKIICGDFNDVPGSYTYYTIKGNDMKDAFLRKGFGFGRTFYRLSPTLRIDFIMTDDSFSVEQVYRLKQRLSDHYGLVADIRLNPPK